MINDDLTFKEFLEGESCQKKISTDVMSKISIKKQKLSLC